MVAAIIEKFECWIGLKLHHYLTIAYICTRFVCEAVDS